MQNKLSSHCCPLLQKSLSLWQGEVFPKHHILHDYYVWPQLLKVLNLTSYQIISPNFIWNILFFYYQLKGNNFFLFNSPPSKSSFLVYLITPLIFVLFIFLYENKISIFKWMLLLEHIVSTIIWIYICSFRQIFKIFLHKH